MNSYAVLCVLSLLVSVNSLEVPTNVSIPLITEVVQHYLLPSHNMSNVEWVGGNNDTNTAKYNDDTFTALNNEVDQEKEITFNICCGKYQRFNIDSNECVDVNETLSKKVEYLLHNFVVDSTMGRSFINSKQLKYGSNMQNTCPNGEVIRELFLFMFHKNNALFIFYH